MRYVVVKQELSDIHPLWPGQTVYKYFDTILSYYSYGCWTNKEIAETIVKRKNEGR